MIFCAPTRRVAKNHVKTDSILQGKLRSCMTKQDKVALVVQCGRAFLKEKPGQEKCNKFEVKSLRA